MTENEVLYLHLMEEAAEVQQRASKLLRFGVDEREPGQLFNNAERLRGEINDLLGVISILEENGLKKPTDSELAEAIAAKRVKIARFLKYSQVRGTVESSSG